MSKLLIGRVEKIDHVEREGHEMMTISIFGRGGMIDWVVNLIDAKAMREIFNDIVPGMIADQEKRDGKKSEEPELVKLCVNVSTRTTNIGGMVGFAIDFYSGDKGQSIIMPPETTMMLVEKLTEHIQRMNRSVQSN